VIRLVRACLNCCTKALTRSIRSEEAFASKIRRLELIVIKKVELEKDVSRGRLDLAYVNKVEPYKRFNTAAFTYTLTRLAGFKGSLGAKELGSSLTDFVKSAKGLDSEELGLFGYVQGIVASKEKIRAGARLGEDHDKVSDDGVG
jgi:hypothetical protein